MRALRRFAATRAGSTLTELIIATVIMSIGILGLFGAFRFITRSVFVSRGQTLANNLAQERVEYLKNINYYGLLVTTAPAVDNSFSPGLSYDTVSYPPELISIAGINYTRYTYVNMAQVDNDVITDVGSNYPDTGMKLITVHVVWTDNGVRKKWSLRNLLENPYVNPLDATITGTITKAAGGGGLAGAVVSVEQNPDWNATTDASGNYNFKVYHGTYSVRASSAGYYDAISTAQVVPKGGSKSYNLALVQIATGTVAGIAWYNPDLVISQVVANTFTFVAGGLETEVEYIELFNPTTYPMVIGCDTCPFPQKFNIWYYEEDSLYTRYMGFSNSNPGDPAMGFQKSWTHTMYVSTYIAPGGYYTVANSSYFCVNSTWVHADAYYYDFVNPDYPNLIRNDKAGGLYLMRYPYAYGGNPSDVVGWSDNDNVPPVYEGTAIPDIGAGNDGIGTPAGKQIVRVSSPAANMTDIAWYGRSYDSGSNQRDWLYTYNGGPSFFFSPYTTRHGTWPVLTGKPAIGAFVSAGDVNSNSTQTLTAYISSNALQLPYAPYVLRGVSTGTWEIGFGFTTGWPFYQTVMNSITSVTVTQNAIRSIPTAVSTPSWKATNQFHVHLTSQSGMGFVRGTVRGGSGNSPLANIRVEGGGGAKLTGSNGQYFMSVTSGTVNLIANPNNLNGAYIQSIQPVTVTSSAITVQDFSLSLGGRITGYATSGTTPLSNVVFVAMKDGSQAGSGTTDASGNFTIRNLSTATYTVEPVLEVGQDVSPNDSTVVMTTTGSWFSSTFTVSGAFGNIYGTVSDASGLLTSGALLVASTSSISSTPPSVVGSSAPAMTPYYMVSSRADGTYTMPVRGSNTYYLSVYVPIISGSTVSITTKTYSNIYVSPSATTTRNITVP
jgi:hypothetical protein